MVYLGFKARSEAEIRKYLEKKEYAPDEIDHAIAQLHEYKLISDIQYAQAFVKAKPGNGKYLLKQKLRQRGIDQETAEEALQAISPEEEEQNAYSLLQKRLRGDTDKLAIQKAMQAVMRRGFSYDTVKAAVQRYNDEIEWED